MQEQQVLYVLRRGRRLCTIKPGRGLLHFVKYYDGRETQSMSSKYLQVVERQPYSVLPFTLR